MPGIPILGLGLFYSKWCVKQQISHLFESDVVINRGYDIRQTPRNRRTPRSANCGRGVYATEVGLCLQGTPGERLGKNRPICWKKTGETKSNGTSWSDVFFFRLDFFLDWEPDVIEFYCNLLVNLGSNPWFPNDESPTVVWFLAPAGRGCWWIDVLIGFHQFGQQKLLWRNILFLLFFVNYKGCFVPVPSQVVSKNCFFLSLVLFITRSIPEDFLLFRNRVVYQRWLGVVVGWKVMKLRYLRHYPSENQRMYST